MADITNPPRFKFQCRFWQQNWQSYLINIQVFYLGNHNIFIKPWNHLPSVFIRFIWSDSRNFHWLINHLLVRVFRPCVFNSMFRVPRTHQFWPLSLPTLCTCMENTWPIHFSGFWNFSTPIFNKHCRKINCVANGERHKTSGKITLKMLKSLILI
jgi:hypothetical protein